MDVIKRSLTPYVEKEKYNISRRCGLHPGNSIYRDREQHKSHIDINEWQRGYCKKTFYEEKHIDQHFDNRHFNLLNLLFVMALIAMTLFFRPDIHHNNQDDAGVYAGALFFTLITVMLSGMSEISITIAKLRVFYKQLDLPFYPSSAYAIPAWILKIPVTLNGSSLWEMKEQVVSEDRLVLFKGVSGAFKPGVLTALMGVSGIGKTTLMDVLAGRRAGGYIDGDIKVSGYLKKQETFARTSGYCEQNDMHSPHVTVYESLLYSAWRCLPSGVDSKTRKMFIDEVLDLVELSSLSNSLVSQLNNTRDLLLQSN